jgi:hypothetical protein
MRRPPVIVRRKTKSTREPNYPLASPIPGAVRLAKADGEALMPGHSATSKSPHSVGMTRRQLAGEKSLIS